MEMEIELASLDKTIKFIKSDIQGCLNCGVNIGLALILNAYTEYFGHLLTGEDTSGESYNTWLRFMGFPYSTLLDKGYDLYGIIRCGLIHEYTMKKAATIYTEEDDHPAIEIDGNKIFFNNYKYQQDFIESIDRYRDLIQSDQNLQEKYLAFRMTKPLVV